MIRTITALTQFLLSNAASGQGVLMSGVATITRDAVEGQKLHEPGLGMALQHVIALHLSKNA